MPVKHPLIQQRLIAGLIDGLIVLGLRNLSEDLWWLPSAAYWLLRDGCFEGQSVGKRLMDLKVIVLKPTKPTRDRCTFKESIIRNVLWVVPVSLPFMLLSAIYYLANDRHGRHWGDRLANTKVIRA